MINKQPGGVWRCPLCGAPLLPDVRENLQCPAGHSFDRAKEGYWHLLPVQEMRSKQPGDSKEMVAARHAFLNAGYYAVCGRVLGEIVAEWGQKKRAEGNLPLGGLSVLDAGCGEGWYDRCAAESCEKAGLPLALSGFDIAKPAVRLAAKALPEAAYAVASSFHAPVADGAADVLLNIFSPLAIEEFRRMLRPGGLFVYAVPGPRHLFGMKKALYETPYENPVREISYPGFAPIGAREAAATITVPHEMLEALFGMTPYYWKTPADGAAKLRALESLETEICFRFLLFQKL